MVTEQPTVPEASSESGQSLTYRYGIYGISLRSEIPLPLPECSPSSLAEVDLRLAPAEEFARRIEGTSLTPMSVQFREYARLPDRSSYIRWKDVGEFVVSPDGSTIACRKIDECPPESFYSYLLGQALSFALVKKGLEPKHATAVVVDDKAVAFLADCGWGKSSLAAAFLHAGYPVLTDDLLVVQPSPAGLIAYPGPARLKLFPNMARRFLGKQATGAAMNAFAQKLLIPLGKDQVCAAPVPLQAIYVLGAPDGKSGKTIRFEPLSRREAFITLVENTFNYMHTDSDRLARQFTLTARLADTVPLRKLFYPRILNRVPALLQAILADLKSEA